MSRKNPWEPPVIHLPYLGDTRDAAKPQRCLRCKQFQDAATGLSTNAQPKPGNAAICFKCGHIMVFGPDLLYREATTEEHNQIAKIFEVQLVRAHIASRNKKSPWNKSRPCSQQ